MTLRSASLQELVWVHPDPFSRASELRCGSEVVATLLTTNVLLANATGDAEGSRWTFTWQGIVRPIIHVRLAGADSDVATVELPLFGWGGRPWLVRLAAGELFQWAPLRWWNDRVYLLTDATGAVLLRFNKPLFKQRFRRSGKLQESLEITDIARARPDLPLLVLLGKYLIR